MFREQPLALLNIATNNTTQIHHTLDKLRNEMKENNCQLNNIIKDIDDLKLSLETYQDINDDKIKTIETSIEKIKKNYKHEIEQLHTQKKNDEAKDKLRKLEDRLWRDNLRLDGIAEYENE